MNHYTNKFLLLPLLGFLMAGCSTSSNLQTSEADDVYFSSKDKVTYVEPTYEQRSESAQGDNDRQESSEDITERVSDPETYADDRRSRRGDDPYQYSYYDAPFGNPYYAYSPYYSPSRYYSRAAMYDPWYDPFYDPFFRPVVVYDPFWPRPMYSGMMISVGLGWGNPWGYGYGYNPYRYGYGYNPYRYGGYYNDSYYRGDVYARKVNYGPRHDRASTVGVGSASRTGTRDSRSSVSSQNSRNSRTAPDAVIRSSRSSEGTANPTRRRTDSTPVRVEETQRSSPTRSSEGESAPPVRRRRESPETATQRESRPVERTQTRTSYEPARTSEPSRSYEPSRSSSSSSSSGSSSSGSSSGSSRRGRN